MLRVRVVEPFQVPSPVGGEASDGVPCGRDEIPQIVGRRHAARVAAGHADDDDRVVLVGGPCAGDDGAGGRSRAPGQQRQHMCGQRAGGGVVEDGRGGDPQAGGRGEPVAQIDTCERVEAQIPEGAGVVQRLRRGVAEHRGHSRADQLRHRVPSFLLRQPGDAQRPRPGPGGVGRLGRGARTRRADQTAQHGRQSTLLRPRPQRGRVGPYEDRCRVPAGQGRVEQGQSVVDGERGEPRPPPAGQLGGPEAAAHPLGLVPEPPGE